jgi:hypothetical protein
MNRLLKIFPVLLLSAAVAVAFSSPAFASGPIAEGDRSFSNPDELSDCPLAAPAFSGNLHWSVWYTADPGNPAKDLLSGANTDTFTIVIEVSNDLLLNLPAECSGGPHSGDANPGDLAKLNVGTYNLGYGDFLFLTPGDYGTIDDGNPSTVAPSGSAFTYSSVEFYFDSPNIDAGQTTQKVFFTMPSIEPGEVTTFFLQSTSGSMDDEMFVPLPFNVVPVENYSWGRVKATYR